MTQSRTLDTIRTTGQGTLALHSQTGVMYASPHLYNDAAYNLRIATHDPSKGMDGWCALDGFGVNCAANLFGDCPESPGEFCTVGENN